MHRSGLARLAKKGHKQGVQLGAIPKRDRGGAVRVIPREIGQLVEPFGIPWNLLELGGTFWNLVEPCQILGLVARIRNDKVHNDEDAHKMMMELMID